MDITHFPNSYYNPCLSDRWNVLCIIYDTKRPESSAVWLNNGKLLNFTCPTAKESGQLNLFSRDFKDEKAFNRYIALTEIYPHLTSIPEDFTSSRMMALCVEYLVAKQAPNEAIIKRAIAYREKQCFICYRISDDESTVVLPDKPIPYTASPIGSSPPHSTQKHVQPGMQSAAVSMDTIWI